MQRFTVIRKKTINVEDYVSVDASSYEEALNIIKENEYNEDKEHLIQDYTVYENSNTTTYNYELKSSEELISNDVIEEELEFVKQSIQLKKDLFDIDKTDLFEINYKKYVELIKKYRTCSDLIIIDLNDDITYELAKLNINFVMDKLNDEEINRRNVITDFCKKYNLLP